MNLHAANIRFTILNRKQMTAKLIQQETGKDTEILFNKNEQKELKELNNIMEQVINRKKFDFLA